MLKIINLAVFFISILGFANHALAGKNYKITVDAGYPAYTPMAYDRIYFLDDRDNDQFPIGASFASGSKWSQGSQVSVFNTVPLPKKIFVLWFSVLENQFWEGQYSLPAHDFTKYDDYVTVSPFVYQRQLFSWREKFTATTSWTVNVTPGGMVVIWVTGGNSTEKYVLARFQAKRIDYDWDKFIHRFYGPLENFNYPDRQKFIEEWKRHAQKAIKQPLPSKPIELSHFERYFDTYRWQLKLNDAYELKDFEVRTINGERYIVHHGTDQKRLKARAIPYLLDMLVVNKKTGKLERFTVEIGHFMRNGYKPEDWEEIINVFRKMGPDHLINIEIMIDSEKDMLDVLLDNGTKRIMLKQVTAEKNPPYSDFDPVLCPHDDPAKQLTEKDISSNPDDSFMFTLKNDDTPVSNFPYRMLRADGYYYYGRTKSNGDTARIRNLVHGKRLKVDVYEDEREGCYTKENFPKDYDIYHPYDVPKKNF